MFRHDLRGKTESRDDKTKCGFRVYDVQGSLEEELGTWRVAVELSSIFSLALSAVQAAECSPRTPQNRHRTVIRTGRSKSQRQVKDSRVRKVGRPCYFKSKTFCTLTETLGRILSSVVGSRQRGGQSGLRSDFQARAKTTVSRRSTSRNERQATGCQDRHQHRCSLAGGWVDVLCLPKCKECCPMALLRDVWGSWAAERGRERKRDFYEGREDGRAGSRGSGIPADRHGEGGWLF